ncbi:porin [Sulfurirhabdus autotrophica]|uniref:Putative porin n=1 Tax=Sulfurirhabdus autotrophica TaxID=1706046 RepID=A0A4R3XZU5_9PROT|nr:porin [Sulfurirhabdus autotrophica]TCV84672.1 putative porin [Sulfurirhabdus autotrophica]
MNKKLIALAIASALAAPVAMADGGNVKISGQMNFSYDLIKGNAGGTANQTMSNVSSNASNIIFSGDEDLGNGLKAVWQVQTYFTGGGTGNTDSTCSDSSVGCGNTFAGLTGGFGGVYLGKNDTPFKTIGRKVDLFGNTLGDSRNLISSATLVNAAGTTVAKNDSWDLRPSSMVWYASPSMSGFQVIAGYVTNANNLTAGNANQIGATSATSVAAIYANGPVFAGLAWEKHQVGGTNDAPKAWRLTGGYDFGVAKVVALYEDTKNTTAAANTDDDRKVWGLGAAFKLDGANTLKAQYYKAKDIGNVSNTGANMWALGADHAMSKRTTAYVAYARTNNKNGDTTANVFPAYSVSGGGHGDNAGSVGTQATSGVSVGMIHNF